MQTLTEMKVASRTLTRGEFLRIIRQGLGDLKVTRSDELIATEDFAELLNTITVAGMVPENIFAKLVEAKFTEHFVPNHGDLVRVFLVPAEIFKNQPTKIVTLQPIKKD